MRILYLTILSLAFLNCNGAKKQVLELEGTKGSLQRTNVHAEFVPQAGVKYTEQRQIDKKTPPIKLDLKGELKKGADLNFSIKNIRLKRPDSKPFFEPSGMTMIRGGSYSLWTLRPQAIITENYILAGSSFSGLYCYDKEGTFLFTIAKPSPDAPKNPNKVQFDIATVKDYLLYFSVADDICLYTIMSMGKQTHHIFNLREKKELGQLSQTLNQPMLINSSTLSILNYTYQGVQDVKDPMMSVHSSSGETICVFNNYNMTPSIQGETYANMTLQHIYYYDKTLTINQGANDTIFRLKSENKLVPQYIFDLGDRKATVQELVSSKYGGRRVIDNIHETKDFLIISYDDFKTDNHSTKNTACYNKKNEQLYQIEHLKVEGIPVDLEHIESYNGELYIKLTGKKLEHMVKDKTLDKTDQVKIKTLSDDLSRSGDLMVSVFRMK